MTDRAGQQLGNYHLIRLLGQGGFAQVYLGEHIHLETQAAIKVLNIQVGSNDVEPFRKEARTIARLEHPHIVRVLDFGVEGTTPFLELSRMSLKVRLLRVNISSFAWYSKDLSRRMLS